MPDPFNYQDFSLTGCSLETIKAKEKAEIRDNELFCCMCGQKVRADNSTELDGKRVCKRCYS